MTQRENTVPGIPAVAHSSSEEATLNPQINKYFIAIMSFAVVATSMSAGVLIAFVSLVAALVAMQITPALTAAATERGAHRRRRAARRGRTNQRRKIVAARPLADEDEYQLVPDEPSLILSVSE